MMETILLPLLLQLCLILCNAVFACAEIAIVTVNENRLALLAQQGDKRAQRLAQLTGRPARFLATIQIAITLSGFLGSAFAADHFSDPVTAFLLDQGIPLSEATLDALVVVLITLLLSFLTLIFGELVPKRIGMQKAEPLALALAGPITAISKLFSPIVSVLTFSTNAVLRLLGIDPNAQEDEVSEEEIKMMVDRGSRKGIFDQDTKAFITNLFAFDDITVGEFATHRTDLAFLWMDQTSQQWQETILSTRHTRYPVCGETVDQVVGILDARDFFSLPGADVETLLAQVVKPAFFVPETAKADVLFRQMRARRRYYAVVLDEYGGFLGVVTIRDLLEQLVGDIAIEGELPEIEALDDHTWRVRGTARLDDVAHLLAVDLPLEEYETFGGYVFGLHGTIPQDGQTLTLRTDALRIQVEEVRDHKLLSAAVTVLGTG